ncbi:hypothetical protein [Nonomuraea sp. LPB2021202275-12-8]|uniref:hypothetical protein n=1 Tax=Nonomuraea sp. LPB2021202275-12-8 TaxID=3120159 RepID=UPI00300C2AAC
MSDRLDDLERRIDELRAGVRKAMRARDSGTARILRAELRTAERAWDALVSHDGAAPEQDGPAGRGTGSDGPARQGDGAGRRGGGDGRGDGRGDGLRLVTVREQVHQALTLLDAPAQARLIVAVSQAFFSGTIRSPQLTSLRRDEERSFKSSPYARPYYLCAALTDRLSPARGLLAVSTWPAERRLVGPLSPRVDFLTCAVQVARHVGDMARPLPDADRLLARMARNIPGAGDDVFGPPDPGRVIEAARRELRVHAGRDTQDRAELAKRATSQLGAVAGLFGAATLSTVADRRSTGRRGGR